MEDSDKTPRILWSVVIFLVFTGVAVVVRRTLVLVDPARFAGNFAPARALDDIFALHRSLTLVHIIPGFLFMLLGPLQFVKNIRSRYPTLHRWSGRVLVVSGLIIGFTAIWMSLTMSIGGVNQAAATLLFAVLFLFSLVKAFLHIRRREIPQHREWMLRAYAIGLAVATIRPIIGIFFATSRLTHLTPHDFFGTAFWLGFTLQLIAAESWIHYTRGKLVLQAASCEGVARVP
ncbi:MAG TPA: DUF2306 domain-containing protein [Candidatus Acidoferrum sp.]|jgi:uncharacterized membrane protein|nr:DUF2306 domain-containing protein [Candidatus Acidoferrum sp.]